MPDGREDAAPPDILREESALGDAVVRWIPEGGTVLQNSRHAAKFGVIPTLSRNCDVWS